MGTFFWTLPQRSVKNLNKHVILDLIRFTPGGISRVELARQMGLTRAAVTTIINDLEKSGIVREGEQHTSGGRRPIGLEINPNQGVVVGVDMGATHMNVILADYLAHVIKEKEIPFDIEDGPEICLGKVDQVVRQVVSDAGLTMEQIHAYGVDVPGPIVSEAGRVSGPPIMPGWDEFPIREWLEDQWKSMISLNNDAEMGALGEWAYGAGRGERNLAYIKVGTGIGAGLLLDGQIYRGTTGSAGEIGHTTINENGPICSCGNRGCLEAIAGGKAIARRAQDEISKGRRTQLIELGNIDSLNAKDVIRAARQGDLLSQQIVAEAGVHLGTAIAGLVNLFNPSVVVVGGGVSQIGDLLLEPIRQTVHQRSLLVASRAVRVTASLLGRRSSAMGTVIQAISLTLHRAADRE